MMVRTPKYELIEERLGIPLETALKEGQAAGLSTRAIARQLAAATNVQVTGETVRQWLRALEVPAA